MKTVIVTQSHQLFHCSSKSPFSKSLAWQFCVFFSLNDKKVLIRKKTFLTFASVYISTACLPAFRNFHYANVIRHKVRRKLQDVMNIAVIDRYYTEYRTNERLSFRQVVRFHQRDDDEKVD